MSQIVVSEVETQGFPYEMRRLDFIVDGSMGINRGTLGVILALTGLVRDMEKRINDLEKVVQDLSN